MYIFEENQQIRDTYVNAYRNLLTKGYGMKCDSRNEAHSVAGSGVIYRIHVKLKPDYKGK